MVSLRRQVWPSGVPGGFFFACVRATCAAGHAPSSARTIGLPRTLRAMLACSAPDLKTSATTQRPIDLKERAWRTGSRTPLSEHLLKDSDCQEAFAASNFSLMACVQQAGLYIEGLEGRDAPQGTNKVFFVFFVRAPGSDYQLRVRQCLTAERLSLRSALEVYGSWQIVDGTAQAVATNPPGLLWRREKILAHYHPDRARIAPKVFEAAALKRQLLNQSFFDAHAWWEPEHSALLNVFQP